MACGLDIMTHNSIKVQHLRTHTRSYAFPKKLRKGDMSKELKEIWDGIPPGRKCIVKIDNATMHIRIGHSSYMHSIRSKDIQKGSVIEICGSEDMDGIPVTTVSDSDGDSGTFWPNDFGNISRFVEEIEYVGD